jgi:DNA-binding CsgD family transcriptional regulator
VGTKQWQAAEKILRRGIDPKRIATEVGVSPHTVETTLWNVKLGLLPV